MEAQKTVEHLLMLLRERHPGLAAREGGQSLRPHLLAALLTASLDGTHPLHAAARNTPELLERLDALATVRDTSAAHAKRRPAPPLPRLPRSNSSP